MKAYYHSCDIFVLPSVGNNEAFGLVQLEAMACGKAVVNTAVQTAVPHVSLDGQTGITVPPADVERLATAINTLLGDEDLRIRYGHNAVLRAREHFAIRKMVEGTYRVYEKCLEKRMENKVK